MLCSISWEVPLKAHGVLAASVSFGLQNIHMVCHMRTIYMAKMSYLFAFNTLQDTGNLVVFLLYDFAQHCRTNASWAVYFHILYFVKHWKMDFLIFRGISVRNI